MINPYPESKRNAITAPAQPQMKVGGKYNWRGQSERLIYMGRNWSGNGYWHQFAKVESPTIVWCEALDSDLLSFEETAQLTPAEVLDWLADQHRAQCGEDRPIQEWIRKMKGMLP